MPVDAAIRTFLDDEEADDLVTDHALEHRLVGRFEAGSNPRGVASIAELSRETAVEAEAPRGERVRRNLLDGGGIRHSRLGHFDRPLRRIDAPEPIEPRPVHRPDEADPEFLERHRFAKLQVIESTGDEPDVIRGTPALE